MAGWVAATMHIHMAQSLTDAAILQVALVGLEHQKAEIESKMADIQVRLVLLR